MGTFKEEYTLMLEENTALIAELERHYHLGSKGNWIYLKIIGISLHTTWNAHNKWKNLKPIMIRLRKDDQVLDIPWRIQSGFNKRTR